MKVAEITGLDIEDIKKMRLYKFEDGWLKKLVAIHTLKDLENLEVFPNEIAGYLKELKEVASHFENAIIAPLYVANLRYYTGVFYRFLKNNTVYAKGGEYVVEGERSVGFSIYTDNLLKDING
jgi:histidyl-tRNA synthetase